MQGLFDCHVHADGLRDADLSTLARFGLEQVLVCAHDGAIPRADKATARDWLAQFERLLTVEAARFRRHGLRPLFALGVHPTAAPWHGLEEVLQKLPVFLSEPAVVAIGVLGLRDLGVREHYVLRRQLELAAELRRPVVVAAPVRAPLRGLRALLDALRSTELPADRALIENVTPRGLALADACGHFVALEASSGRLTSQQIVAAVRANGGRRFVLTSHAGDGAADLLAVPSLASTLQDAGLSRSIVARIGRENALRFLGRADSIRQSRTG